VTTCTWLLTSIQHRGREGMQLFPCYYGRKLTDIQLTCSSFSEHERKHLKWLRTQENFYITCFWFLVYFVALKRVVVSLLSVHFPYGPKWATISSSPPGSLRYHLPTLREHDLSLYFSKLKIKQNVLWNDSKTAQKHTVQKSQNRVNIACKLPRKFETSYTLISTCLLIVGVGQDFYNSIDQYGNTL